MQLTSTLRTLVACALAACTASAAAQDTRIAFQLDWRFEGPSALFLVAKAKGYFAQEKLAVTIDQGDGSAAAVTKVMAGAYQAGFGDVNAIVQNASAKPGMATKFKAAQVAAVEGEG